MSNDDKTRIIRPLDQLQRPPPLPSDNDETRKMPDREDAASSADGEDYEKTQLVRPASAKPRGDSFDPLAPAAAEESTNEDPVVGWLVVVSGPGRGNAVRLGYGWNSIGRDASQRARLDFGDSQISRVNHVKLLYDPRSRKFTLTLGESINPTYVRGDVVTAPTELKNGDRISMGNTEVMFVALCGETFDWQ